jgi:hypothetical protein
MPMREEIEVRNKETGNSDFLEVIYFLNNKP